MLNVQGSIQLDQQISILPAFAGVCFDHSWHSLYGNYEDQLSAYRAKKSWEQSFAESFELKKHKDYQISVMATDLGSYLLVCRFTTDAGKYAFWKTTNHQAPEVQYVVETAHIPVCDNRYEELLSAPDLRSVYEIIAPADSRAQRTQSKLFA